MDIHIINAIILPLFITWFIPNAIRNPKTGKYIGLLKGPGLLQLVLLSGLESILLLNEFGLELLTIARIVFCVFLSALLAFVYVVVTQKKRFGNEFDFKSIHRSGS